MTIPELIWHRTRPWLSRVKRRLRDWRAMRAIDCDRSCVFGTGFHCAGAGQVKFGRGVRIGRNVSIETGGPASRILLGESVQIGDGACLQARGDATLQAADHVRIGDGCRLVADSSLVLGEHSVLGHGVAIERREDPCGGFVCGARCHVGDGGMLETSGSITLGDDCQLGPGCIIYTHNHLPDGRELIWENGLSVRPVAVGRGVWIGARSLLLPGVEVGDHAVIGAGAVVTGRIAGGEIAAGIPARLIRRRSTGA